MLVDWEKFALFNNYGQTNKISNNNYFDNINWTILSGQY